MPGIEFYEKLLNNPCEGCAAYEEIGGCGTWINTCKVPQWTEDLYQLLLFVRILIFTFLFKRGISSLKSF